MRSITVVGASLAGLSTVRALRAEGYDGEIVVVGEERHTPYDRPPLSKDFLKGDLDAEALALGDADEHGDVARCPNPFTGRHARIEHWSNATEQAKTAARTLLTGVSAPAPLTAPYFWSDQYQVRIQLAGHVAPGAEPQVVEGDVDSRSFTAVYRREGTAVAVLSLNQPKFFNRLRRTLLPATAAAAV
jgi:NADPH-dependent 2,4-dienoyl-CoA reductase/sulfur reductase-like enzyme